MKQALVFVLTVLLVLACAQQPVISPLQDYEELDATMVLDAPSPVAGQYAPQNRYVVERGEYLVELLGCGGCHTDGALEGAPDMDRPLAGSGIGIAYSNPLGDARPGIVFPPNITPDTATGIGDWSDAQIANAVRVGLGRHIGRRIAVMPWQGYAKLSRDDTQAIVAYLRSIEAIDHQVPAEVEPGRRSRAPFVYFGVYRSRD